MQKKNGEREEQRKIRINNKNLTKTRQYDEQILKARDAFEVGAFSSSKTSCFLVHSVCR